MTDIQKVQMAFIPKIKTGPIQFEQDWPGYFIRGQDAMLLSFQLRMAAVYISRNPDLKYVAGDIAELADQLNSCIVESK